MKSKQQKRIEALNRALKFGNFALNVCNIMRNTFEKLPASEQARISKDYEEKMGRRLPF